MTVVARNQGPLISRFRLQVAAALVAGITIGTIAGPMLTTIRPSSQGIEPATAAGVQASAPSAPQRATTSASEEYRAMYSQPTTVRDAMRASRQYRAVYTGEE
jgi:hypothetical protein